MKVIRFSCLLAALCALGGCSEPTGPRTVRAWGEVSYDGAAVEDGTIDFVPTDDASPAQAQIKAGRYDLPAPAGPLSGKVYRVEISAMKKSGKTLRNVMGDGEPTMQPLENMIPPDYNAQSTLKVTTSKDSSKNQFDFALKKVATKPPR